MHWNNVSKSFDCEVTQLYLNNLGAVIANREQCGWKIDGYDPKAEKALEEWKAQEEAKKQQS